MEHGISASNGLKISRKAGIERINSDRSIARLNDMIEGYEAELAECRARIEQMEYIEVQRLDVEV